MIFFSKVSLSSKCELGAVFWPPGRKKKEKRTLILTFVKKNIYFFLKVILPSEWSPELYFGILDLQER
jgi:hypothetical protein